MFPNSIVKDWIENNKKRNDIIWQIQWIGKNIHMYEGELHANCVAMNIIRNDIKKKFNIIYKSWKDTQGINDAFAVQKFIEENILNV